MKKLQFSGSSRLIAIFDRGGGATVREVACSRQANAALTFDFLKITPQSFEPWEQIATSVQALIGGSMATNRVVPITQSKMKVAQISKPGAGFQVVEREVPSPGPGQVRI